METGSNRQLSSRKKKEAESLVISPLIRDDKQDESLLVGMDFSSQQLKTELDGMKGRHDESLPLLSVPFESSETNNTSAQNMRTPRTLQRNESNFSKASKTTAGKKKKKKGKKSTKEPGV